MIISLRYYSFYSGGNGKFGANVAKRHLAIYSRAIKRNTKASGLYDCILFRMRGSDTMLRLRSIFIYYRVHFMPDFVTMRKPRRRADITGRNNSFVPYNHAPAPTSIASCPGTDEIYHPQEVFIPRGSLVFFGFRSNFFHVSNILLLILLSKSFENFQIHRLNYLFLFFSGCHIVIQPRYGVYFNNIVTAVFGIFCNISLSDHNIHSAQPKTHISSYLHGNFFES